MPACPCYSGNHEGHDVTALRVGSAHLPFDRRKLFRLQLRRQNASLDDAISTISSFLPTYSELRDGYSLFESSCDQGHQCRCSSVNSSDTRTLARNMTQYKYRVSSKVSLCSKTAHNTTTRMPVCERVVSAHVHLTTQKRNGSSVRS